MSNTVKPITEEIYNRIEYVAVGGAHSNTLHIPHSVHGGDKDNPICGQGKLRSKPISTYPKGTKPICSRCIEMYKKIDSNGISNISPTVDEITTIHTRDNVRTSVPSRLTKSELIDEYIAWHDNNRFYIGNQNNKRVREKVSVYGEDQTLKSGQVANDPFVGVKLRTSEPFPRVPSTIIRQLSASEGDIVLWTKTNDLPYIQAEIL